MHKFARIKQGALVGQDHGLYTWPWLPSVDLANKPLSLIFLVVPAGGNLHRLVRPHFGARRAYGCGGVYVFYPQDLEFLESFCENSC